MSEHTPEPWDWEPDAVIGERECHIVPCVDTDYEIALVTDGCLGASNAEANARRIVACVNACAGMEDPAAEIARLRAENATLRQGIMDAAAQADERVTLRLLVGDLLRVVRANHDGGTHEGTDCPICDLIARAALSRPAIKEATK